MSNDAKTGKAPRLALIGCGFIAEFGLGPSLRRLGLAPAVLVDASPARLEAIARKLSSPPTVVKTSDWRTALDSFDAAIVAVPHMLHASIGVDLMNAGKHVFMEKPLAATVEECRAMNEAAARNNVLLTVGLLRRYVRAPRWAKALIESGALGALTRVEAREGVAMDADISSPALLNRKLAGGGVLMDTGAHTLDLVSYLTGALEIQGYQDDDEGGVEADCVIEARLANGAPTRIELSRTRDLRNSIRIEGERGFVEIHVIKNEVLAGSPNALSFQHEGQSPKDFKPQFPAELFDAELRVFRDSIAEGRQLGVSGEEGARSVALIEQCYAARAPMPLPWLDVRPGDEAVLPRLPAGSKALVTGASGFIGGRLAERLVLDQGVGVRTMIRNTGRATRLARLPVEIRRADIGNAEDIDSAMEGVDYVFHCAYDIRSRAQNVDSLTHLLDACARNKVKRLVYVSSFAVYQPFRDGPLTEETPDGDRSSVYTDVKLNLEAAVLQGARERGVAATIIQPTIVYGPFGKFWTNRIAEMLIHGDVILPDRGEGLCNAIYVDDLVDGMILSAIAPAAVGERFIMSGPGTTTWGAFFEAFAKAVDAPSPHYVPRDKISGGGGGSAIPDPRTIIKNFVKWPPARSVLQSGLDVMPGPLKTAVMNYYFGGGGRSVGQTYAPDKEALNIYTSMADATPEKATRLLGYAPRFNLDRGMEATGAYLRWAFADIAQAAQEQKQALAKPAAEQAPASAAAA